MTKCKVTLLIVVGAVLGVHANTVAQTSVFADNFDSYPSDGALRQEWPWSSWNYNMGMLDGGNWILETNTLYLWSPPHGGRIYNGGDENGRASQNQAYLSPYIQAAYGDTEINGTDASPLILEFWMNCKVQTAACLSGSNGYMELALTDELEPPRSPPASDQAPTDFVMVGNDDGAGCEDCYHTCGSPDFSVHVPWPTICQQEFPRAVSPDPCPPLQTNVRSVIAIGALSFLDNNPCHCETPAAQKPRNEHLSLYDGLKWRILKSGMFPKIPGYEANDDNFVYGTKVDLVKIWIKTDTIDVLHWAKKEGVTSTAAGIPREYLGGFNVLRAGVGVGCELNNGTYSCKGGIGGYRPLRMGGGTRCDGGGYQASDANFVTIDNVELKGGIGGSTLTGACCIPDDGSCHDGEEVTQEYCETTLGGAWRGIGSDCATEVCCVDPFADGDGDGDVDQGDFGTFQACFTGPGPATVVGQCTCFDRDNGGQGDQDVDGDDYGAFEACASGPDIPADPACDGP